MNIEQFQRKIGYFFKNEDLLRTAFTHTSYANEHGLKSYERLEFLGDAIVDMVVGEYLFKNYPDMPEGDMSRARALLVCEKYLASLALEIGIDDLMLLGKGSLKSGDRKRPSILSDMFEAHVAAMYLDCGFENTRDYILSVYKDRIDETVREGHFEDFKTKLQEKMQENGACDIQYVCVNEEGPVHDCIFTVNVVCDGRVLGKGTSNSKKKAAQIAARDALYKM